ncbi:hypothetical protein ACS0TY_021154 [Phlomoides rotata]
MIKVNTSSIKLGGCLPVDCQGSGKGRSGGLCLLWKDSLRVELVSFSTNHIAANIVEQDTGRVWQCTGVYGWPNRNQRMNTFQLIRRLAPRDNTPWLCMGDFNETLWTWEKKGGTVMSRRIWRDSDSR